MYSITRDSTAQSGRPEDMRRPAALRRINKNMKDYLNFFYSILTGM